MAHPVKTMPYVDKNALKERVADYLRIQHGIQNPYYAFSSPWREDKHPSCTLDRNSFYVRDWARGKSFDVFEMARLDFGATKFPEQIKAVAEVLNVPIVEETASQKIRQNAKIKPKTPAFEKPVPITGENIIGAVNKATFELLTSDNANVKNARQYFHDRGFTDSDIVDYQWGFCQHPKVICPNFTNFPYGDGGYIVLSFPNRDNVHFGGSALSGSEVDEVRYCVFRPMFQVGSKELKPKGTAPIYREYRLRQPGVLYVTEGLFDAAALEILMGVRACATCGSNTKRLLSVLAATPNDQRPSLVLALDTDSGGWQMTNKLIADLLKIDASFDIARPYPAGNKDANEVLKMFIQGGVSYAN